MNMSMNNEIKQTPLMQVTWDGTYVQHRDGISLDPNTQYFQNQYPNYYSRIFNSRK
ncbi:hypothetical protein GCM10007041_38620 [Butyricimonas faecihominis]|nr:hypothetical protein Bfae18676_01250 [Butyricimonas faecihominis]BEI57181.1 hypothetical protein Bfae18676_21560 [Butyricimonas faecihominis]GGJ45271.1 hypothetical protein GCM10007041_38620 [Butyricimonas faecihominis]